MFVWVIQQAETIEASVPEPIPPVPAAPPPVSAARAVIRSRDGGAGGGRRGVVNRDRPTGTERAGALLRVGELAESHGARARVCRSCGIPEDGKSCSK